MESKTDASVLDGAVELTWIQVRRNELRAALPRLFGEMDESARLEIEERLEWLRVGRGETVFQRGDASDAIYFVLGGRLQVFLPGAEGAGTVLGEVARGDFVGEMAALTDEPRSASVRALRESQLVRLSRDSVHELTDRHPRMLMHIARMLIHRQRRQYADTAERPRLGTIAVVGLGEGAGVEELAGKLAGELGLLGPTCFVDAASAAEALGGEGPLDVSLEDPRHFRLTTWLAALEARHDHVILLAGHRRTPWAETCVRHADGVLLVGRAGDDPEPSQAERALLAGSKNAGLWVGLVLLHEDGTRLPAGTARWLGPRTLDQHHHVRPGRPADLARLARRLGGKAIGVALGGGGARGGAHLGVLRAMRGAGIAIDAIGGTSAGAGVAALYAMGLDDAAIQAICIEGFVKNNPFRALTLPLVSLVSRRKMDQQARRMYGDIQIEDLWIDYFCVACNLTTGSAEILRTGPLWKAVRASTSLPGVAVPVVHHGNLLVDGGVVDNLPGRIMRRLVGGRVVVVDVNQDEPLSTSYTYEDLPTTWQLLWSRVSPFRRRIRLPSLASVVLRTMTVGSREERASALEDADLVLQPPVSRFGMFEFAAIEEMAEVAEAYTADVLRSCDFS